MAEEDPVADFLKREQEDMKGLEDAGDVGETPAPANVPPPMTVDDDLTAFESPAAPVQNGDGK